MAIASEKRPRMVILKTAWFDDDMRMTRQEKQEPPPYRQRERNRRNFLLEKMDDGSREGKGGVAIAKLPGL